MFRALVITASLVIILAGIKVAAPLVVPFLLSLFLAIVLAPPFFRLQKIGLPGPVALAIMIVALAALCLLAVTILRTSIDLFVQSLPAYQSNLKDQLSSFASWLEARGISETAALAAVSFNPQTVVNFAGALARSLSGLLGQAFVIFIITAFMLFEARHFDEKLRIVLGEDNKNVIELQGSIKGIRRYVSLKTLMCLMTGVLISLLLWLLGIEHALFMGLLAFFLNYIPNIGSLIAAVPGVLLGLIQFGPAAAALTAGGYVMVNIVVSSILEPRVMGKDLGISPLVILLSLVFWGWLLGPVGMLLSVPLTMIVKKAIENMESTKSVAVLMGPAPTDMHDRNGTQR